VNFSRIILFSANGEVISFCKHALEPDYSILIFDHSSIPSVLLAAFPCVVIVDIAVLDDSLEEQLKTIALRFSPLFLISWKLLLSGSIVLKKNCCIPFPSDMDLLRHAVQKRIDDLPDIPLLTNRQGLLKDMDIDISGFEKMVGKSKELRSVKQQLATVAPKELTILLLGESGTGKTLAAELIHKYSQRRSGNYVPVDMASIPEGLAESELFGTVPGAYTGAVKRAGRFGKADGGTLFMDEIAETSLSLQSKLLTVLESGNFCSVGSDTERHVDVRLICATNANLLLRSRKGMFREDLYYRIADYTIVMPPLRDRPDDIKELAENILKDKNKILSRIALEKLQMHNWPGNVRQLKSCLRRACIIAKSHVILPECIRF
jgi:DNA-binding NtrC family response regulator